MANDKNLFAFELKGFWMDVGQPKDYLIGMGFYLNHVRHSYPDQLSTHSGVVGNVLLVKNDQQKEKFSNSIDKFFVSSGSNG